ncbi:acyltransferase family protein [Solidesulfovibrio sp.]|uniref:acyltransferase family protein n=1 Tax=Solidesulfovibrio sp. TaxID=2910990 RepID=UPI002626AE76|nr:acyltransferase family protein [Solidesulfovibrio sp.]
MASHPPAPAVSDRFAFDRRVSVAISAARLVLMAGIVTGHAMLVGDFFGLYAPGLPYPAGTGGFAAFRAALAGQGGLFDRLAFAGGLTFWSLNFSFYALSGFSLWYAVRRRGVFDLRDYFFGRFFGIYLGFAVAALAAFAVAVGVLGHKPGEHDLNFLLLGVARARETMAYNDTLWFLTVLFVLYLVFPAVPALYRRLRLPGLVALLALFTWLRLTGTLAGLSFLPTAFSFFLLGIVAADALHALGGRLRGRAGAWILGLAAAATAAACAVRLHGLAYADVLAAGNVTYDTHALGTASFFLILALGLLAPDGRRYGAALRTAARGTFAVYVYHYLLFQLYKHAPAFHEAVLAVTARLPEFVRDHFLAGALLLYGVLLAGGVLYQLAFDRLLAGPLRRLFENPIALEK